MGFKDFISSGWNSIKEGIGHTGKFLENHQSLLNGLGNTAEVLGNFIPGVGIIGKGLKMAANIAQNVSEDKQRQQQEEKQKIDNETYKTYMEKMKNHFIIFHAKFQKNLKI